MKENRMFWGDLVDYYKQVEVISLKGKKFPKYFIDEFAGIIKSGKNYYFCWKRKSFFNRFIAKIKRNRAQKLSRLAA